MKKRIFTAFILAAGAFILILFATGTCKYEAFPGQEWCCSDHWTRRIRCYRYIPAFFLWASSDLHYRAEHGWSFHGSLNPLPISPVTQALISVRPRREIRWVNAIFPRGYFAKRLPFGFYCNVYTCEEQGCIDYEGSWSGELMGFRIGGSLQLRWEYDWGWMFDVFGSFDKLGD